MSNFPYRQLKGDEIRLVTILPFNRDTGIVECNLTHEPLSTATFSALSYVWGDAADQESILLDGKPFGSTRNLNRFLLMLAQNDVPVNGSRRPYKVWVDAICINQEDIPERNSQVSRMGSIYRTALSTTVWLGEAGEHTTAGIKALKKVYADIFSTGLSIQITEDMACRGVQAGQRFIDMFFNIVDEPGHYAGLGIQDLFSRPWWKRIWILQEFALAQDVRVFCGDIYLRSNEIIACLLAGRIMSRVGKEDTHWKLCQLQWGHFANIAGLRRPGIWPDEAETNRDYHLNLLPLMEQLSNSGCSDDRDRVYGILEFCSDLNSGEITPDYNLPIRDVYLSVVRAYLDKHQNLDILTGPPPSATHDLDGRPWPGWLPRWDSEDWPKAKLPWKAFVWDGGDEDEAVQKTPYDASRRVTFSDHPWTMNESAGSLQVSGAVVDTIKRVSPNASITNAGSWGRLFWGVFFKILNWFGVSQEDQTSIDKFLRGVFIIWNFVNVVWGLEEVYKMTGEEANTALLKTITADWEGDRREAVLQFSGFYLRETAARLGTSVTTRQVAVTSRGMLCLVPMHARVGDLISFLVGGRVLYVLRDDEEVMELEKEKPGKKYRFIGDAYVHGLMDGEVTEMGLVLEPMVLL